MGEQKEEKEKRGQVLQLLIVADSLLLEFTNKTERKKAKQLFGGKIWRRSVSSKDITASPRALEDQDHYIKLVASK